MTQPNYISFSPTELTEFSKKVQQAESMQQDTLYFRGMEFDTGYAKHLISYLTDRYEQAGTTNDPFSRIYVE